MPACRLVLPHPSEVQDQLDALPGRARAWFDDAVVEILDSPWDSRPLNYAKPSGLRVRPFADGFGIIVFQVLDFEAVQIGARRTNVHTIFPVVSALLFDG